MSTKAEHFAYLEAVRSGGSINMWGAGRCVANKFSDVSLDESNAVLVEWYEYKGSEAKVYEVLEDAESDSSETLVGVVMEKFPDMRIDFALVYVELFRRDLLGVV